jgi:hypothetical protein
MGEQAVGFVIKNVLMAFSMGLVVVALILSVRSYVRGALPGTQFLRYVALTVFIALNVVGIYRGWPPLWVGWAAWVVWLGAIELYRRRAEKQEASAETAR